MDNHNPPTACMIQLSFVDRPLHYPILSTKETMKARQPASAVPHLKRFVRHKNITAEEDALKRLE